MLLHFARSAPLPNAIGKRQPCRKYSLARFCLAGSGPRDTLLADCRTLTRNPDSLDQPTRLTLWQAGDRPGQITQNA